MSPKGYLLLQDFWLQYLYLSHLMRATFLAFRIFLPLLPQIILVEWYKLWSFSLRIFPHYRLVCYLFVQVFSSVLWPQTPSILYHPLLERQGSVHKKNVMIPYILIYTFLNYERRSKISEHNASKHLSNWICSQLLRKWNSDLLLSFPEVWQISVTWFWTTESHSDH